MLACQICLDHLPKAQIPNAKITDHCDHVTAACLDCLSQFLNAQIGTVTWDRIGCPICPSMLGFTEIEKYASVDTVARKIIQTQRVRLHDLGFI